MFKTEITYTNFLGTETTDTLRFNLTETELLDLVADDPRFDSNFLAVVSQEKDYAKMMDIIRKLIVVSYGEVSEDGRYFRKSDEKAIDFLQSAAYEAFKDKLLQSDDGHEFVDFMMGIFPAKYSSVLKERISQAKMGIPQIKPVN